MTINLYSTHTVSVVCGCRGAFIPDKTKYYLRAILWTVAVVAKTSVNPSNHSASSGAGGVGVQLCAGQMRTNCRRAQSRSRIASHMVNRTVSCRENWTLIKDKKKK